MFDTVALFLVFHSHRIKWSSWLKLTWFRSNLPSFSQIVFYRDWITFKLYFLHFFIENLIFEHNLWPPTSHSLFDVSEYHLVHSWRKKIKRNKLETWFLPRKTTLASNVAVTDKTFPSFGSRMKMVWNTTIQLYFSVDEMCSKYSGRRLMGSC